MPARPSAASTSGWSSAGGPPKRGRGRVLREASRTSRPSARPSSSRALQGSIVRSIATACDSRGGCRRAPTPDAGESCAPSTIRATRAERIARERERARVGVPAGEGVRGDGRGVVGALVKLRERARSTRSSWSTRPRRTARRRWRRAAGAGAPGGGADAAPTGRCWARATRCGGRCGAARASSCATWTPTPRGSRRTSRRACSGRWSASRGCSSSRRSTAARSSRADRAARGRGARQPSDGAPRARAVLPAARGVRQPLAGEVAARRELLERLPFATGYGVEIGMLIDAWRAVGPGGDRAGRSGGAPQPPPAARGARRRWRRRCWRRSPGACSAKGDCRSWRPGARRSTACAGAWGAMPSRPRSSELRPRTAVASVTPPAPPRRGAVSARCLYLDLDGTLLGRGASLLHDGEGAVAIDGRARGAGVPARGRGGGADVGPAQGPAGGGRAAARPGAPTSTRRGRAWCSTGRSTG